MKQMTLAEAKAEGLLDGKPKLRRTTKRSEPRNGAPSRCCTPGCGEIFTGEMAETRHMTDCGHHRFECVL